jgi:hypothetical protein
MDILAGKQLNKQKMSQFTVKLLCLRTVMRSLNKSQLQDDDEKVTRETAAYDRLDAVLRVTKPLCEKQIESMDDDEDNESIQTGQYMSFDK